MEFKTDQQTTNDLNIFEKNGGKSIYKMFNQTRTAGGAKLLEDMFRFPLTDAQNINMRNSIIKYFMHLPDFPFSVELLDTVENYLSDNDERTRLPANGGILARRLINLLTEDHTFAEISKGIAAVACMINMFRSFTAGLTSVRCTDYNEEHEKITILLTNSAFDNLPPDKGPHPSYEEVGKYDQLFRFKFRSVLKSILTHIYRLDVFITVGKVASSYNLNFPKAFSAEKNVLLLRGVYHPLLDKPITNDLTLTADNNVVFLTGANMAGKSTFMKSLGVAVYLAHMGFPVAAKQMEFSIRNGIYTTINLPDDLDTGASHFYAEVLRLKKIVKELAPHGRLFVMFDELFRGTNLQDAHEATVRITEALAKKRTCIFILSTHIIEAGERLRTKCSNVNFRYLPTTMNGNLPVYSYQLEEGITADRQGMLMINNEGILDILNKGKGETV